MFHPKRSEPKPGQESVWDYPRSPRLESSEKHLQIKFNGVTIVDTRRAKRVLETSHPPVYYFLPEDIRLEYLTASPRTSWCEWKGQARYYHLKVGNRQVQNAAWYYPQPTSGFESLKNYTAFYPGLMDACSVDGEQVQAQAGDFYGGWITNDIVGPFKGKPGSGWW